MNIKKETSGLQIDIDGISDQNTRIIVRHLLNIIETQATEIANLKVENQKLRDENNHLKGEQGKPNIRQQLKKNNDVSSESERHVRNQRKAAKKKRKINLSSITLKNAVLINHNFLLMLFLKVTNPQLYRTLLFEQAIRSLIKKFIIRLH